MEKELRTEVQFVPWKMAVSAAKYQWDERQGGGWVSRESTVAGQ